MMNRWRSTDLRRARYLVPVAVMLLLTAFQYRQSWPTGWIPRPYREGLPTAANGIRDRGFTFCRLLYKDVRYEEMGHGWNTDYPGSDYNFLDRLEELTTARPAKWGDGQPGNAVVRSTQEELYECPFVFMSDVGTMALNSEEAERLRKYLLRGGFLWVDDFWGEYAWDRWVEEITKALPQGEYPIEDLPAGHMIFNALYNVYTVPQVPSIQYWRRSGGATSERGSGSAVPHLRSIRDQNGRIIVLMSHNTDIADGWEREGEDEAFFFQFSPKAYALGINIILYVLTH